MPDHARTFYTTEPPSQLDDWSLNMVFWLCNTEWRKISDKDFPAGNYYDPDNGHFLFVLSERHPDRKRVRVCPCTSQERRGKLIRAYCAAEDTGNVMTLDTYILRFLSFQVPYEHAWHVSPGYRGRFSPACIEER